MIQVNILEQLKTLFNIFINNKNVLIISIISFVSLFALILTSILKNKKITKIICFIIYFGIFGTLFYFYHIQIWSFIDYLMNNIFIFLFFPNLAVWTLVIIITNIILVKSIINLNENKIKKIINIIFFVLFNIIFYLIIDNVINNKVNVYEQLSIYTNNDLMILIQLGMNIFLIWLVLLLIIKLANKIETPSIRHHEKKIVFDNILTVQELENDDNQLKNNLIPENSMAIEDIKDNNYIEIKNDEVIPSKYNEYIDIIPVKKNNVNKVINNIENKNNIEEIDNYIEINNKEDKDHVLLSSMEELFQNNNDNNTNNSDMDVLFGNKNGLETIMSDIEKLKYNPQDRLQIKKIYDEISLNKEDLSLSDYNYLINALVSIKNSN